MAAAAGPERRWWSRRRAVVAAACLAAFVALAAAVQLGRTQELDQRLMVAVGRSRVAWATSILRIVSVLGSGAVEIPAALLLSYQLARTHRRQDAAGFAAATFSGWALYAVAKFTFRRARPRVIPHLMHDAGWYSFPSGHSMLAALVFGLGAVVITARSRLAVRILALIGAACLTLLVGYSRVYLGLHWPSDVAGGLLLGVGWGALWFKWWELAERAGNPRRGPLPAAGRPEGD